MLSGPLKTVRELMEIFRKQNLVVKIIIVVTIVAISRYIYGKLMWGMFSQVYVENFQGASELVLCHMKGCGHCKK